MNPFYAFLCILLAGVLFLLGFFMGIEHGKGIGATAQKNGQITWHTNSVTNVSYTVNK